MEDHTLMPLFTKEDSDAQRMQCQVAGLEVTLQSGRCDLGTEENTDLTPLATWEFDFLLTWSPKLLLLLPHPTTASFLPLLIFTFSALIFEFRFDSYLSATVT